MASQSSTPAATSDLLAVAIERLSGEGLVAYPTETVWGLGACADRPAAIERLFAWKGRRGDQPLAVLVHSVEAAIRLGSRFNAPAKRLAGAFWPGPLTIVVPCEADFASGVARADGALGLRCSSHPIARSLVAALDEAGMGVLTSTSFNRTGAVAAVDLSAAEAMIGGEAEVGSATPLLFAALASGEVSDAGGALPSSVVDCTGPTPKVLRVGAIAADSLEEVWADRVS